MPGLGQVPVNALAVAAFGIFGFAESWIWLVGLGLETAYLYACFTSERFRRLVDAKELVLESAEATKKKTELVASLTPPRRDRLRRLEARCGRILQKLSANKCRFRDRRSERGNSETNRGFLSEIAVGRTELGRTGSGDLGAVVTETD